MVLHLSRLLLYLQLTYRVHPTSTWPGDFFFPFSYDSAVLLALHDLEKIIPFSYHSAVSSLVLNDWVNFSWFYHIRYNGSRSTVIHYHGDGATGDSLRSPTV